MVWTMLQPSGLRYDLERRAIVGLVPRPDMLHPLAIGLSSHWGLHGETLLLRSEVLPPKLERTEMTLKPYLRKLNPEECEAARQLVAEGKSLRQVAAHFNVSRMAIWRIVDSTSKRER